MNFHWYSVVVFYCLHYWISWHLMVTVGMSPSIYCCFVRAAFTVLCSCSRLRLLVLFATWRQLWSQLIQSSKMKLCYSKFFDSITKRRDYFQRLAGDPTEAQKSWLVHYSSIGQALHQVWCECYRKLEDSQKILPYCFSDFLAQAWTQEISNHLIRFHSVIYNYFSCEISYLVTT